MKHASFIHLCYVFAILFVIALAGSIYQMELRAEEPRRVAIAVEMRMGNKWIVSKVHGEYYYYSPLFNWLLTGVFALTNSYNELSVRTPSILAFCSPHF